MRSKQSVLSGSSCYAAGGCVPRPTASGWHKHHPCLGSKAAYTVSRQAAAAAGDGPGTQKALVDKGRRRQSFAPACASGSHSQHQACHASVRLVKTGERCCCCSRGASQREPVCLVEHERRRGGERDAALRHHRRRRRAHNTATARSHMMAQRILSHHKHSILQL